jgi:hypothetical protein
MINENIDDHEDQVDNVINMDNCSICLLDIDDDNKCVTNCNHHFCKVCLQTWLDNSLSCPICREEINNYNHNGEINHLIKIHHDNNNIGNNRGNQYVLRSEYGKLRYSYNMSFMMNICLGMIIIIDVISNDFLNCYYMDYNHTNSTNETMFYNDMKLIY